MAPHARFTIDEPDGSSFHELVILPTLAPQLARPGNLHPAPATNAAPAAAAGVVGTGLAPVTTALDPALAPQAGPAANGEVKIILNTLSD